MNHNLFSRRRIVGSLFVIGAFFTFAALSPTSALAQAKDSTIRIAYNLPKDHATGVYFETLAQEIEKNTAGTSIRIKVRTFPNGQLYNDVQMSDAVSTGTVEIGQINPDFMNTPDAELLRIWNLPFLWHSWEATWYTEDHDVYRAAFQTQFNKIGMRLLSWALYGTADYWANKPIRVPADLKGLRLRTYGVDSSKLARELGASPVTMSSQETYQATQRGILDGFITGVTSVYSRKLYEVVKYGSPIPVVRVSFMGNANLKWWDGLPKDVQTAIEKAAVVAQQTARAKAVEDERHAREAVAKFGVNTPSITVAERELWLAAVKPRYDEYLQKAGDGGRKLMAIVQEANAKYPAR